MEYFHLGRAFSWWVILAIVILVGWQNSVFLVLVYSTYANFGTDLSTWQSRRAERKADSS